MSCAAKKLDAYTQYMQSTTTLVPTEKPRTLIAQLHGIHKPDTVLLKRLGYDRQHIMHAQTLYERRITLWNN